MLTIWREHYIAQWREAQTTALDNSALDNSAHNLERIWEIPRRWYRFWLLQASYHHFILNPKTNWIIIHPDDWKSNSITVWAHNCKYTVWHQFSKGRYVVVLQWTFRLHNQGFDHSFVRFSSINKICCGLPVKATKEKGGKEGFGLLMKPIWVAVNHLPIVFVSNCENYFSQISKYICLKY